jgi:putative transposase
MGRRPRPTAAGFVFHALNRGNNRADVFADDGDRQAFLDALAKTKERYPFRLFGYCLMTNHFHLLIRPERGQSVGRIMQSLTIAHTSRYHKRWQTVGHVWQGRFKSPVIQDDGHLLTVLRYIEANPLRARIVEDLTGYRWSSFPTHGRGVADPLLDPFPGYEGLGRTPAERQARWRRKVMAPQPESELARIRESSRTGKPLGQPEWVASNADRLGIDLNPRPRGRPRKTEN